MSSSSNSDSEEDNDDHGYVVDEDLVNETWEDGGKCKESCIDPLLNMLCDDKKLVKSKHNETDSKDEFGPNKVLGFKKKGLVFQKNDAFEEESVMVEEQGITIQEEGDGVKEVAQMLDVIEDDDEAKDERKKVISVPKDAPIIETQEFVVETQQGSHIVTQHVEEKGTEDTKIHAKISKERKLSERILNIKLKNAVYDKDGDSSSLDKAVKLE
ncbi:hypothetical protein L1887_11503 [Cichorium endivia]|nr:hypothetical protein L1887_11503 [Cichorium endivia]